MTQAPKGAGSQYITATKDSEGQWLNGSNTYMMEIPPNVPETNFWSVILYDAKYHSMVLNEQYKWGVNSNIEGIQQEKDGSIKPYFSPEKPNGVADKNWIQTNHKQAYFVWFRVYGPKESWYDNSWVLPNIEKK
ncbi:DUF1214 domain-containing protein [Galbibacter pacificus]|uniref:DUF1214 domain-containing protein n=1 Tax=Galbibacter pacificus TaxID=2996052 RepID=A0ABT6FQS9_9FLAO|nr:DUF1214 domain-containing protein [Galbibacter pacificus]MDG3581909.1 DUF1214 domain-containing protein [Galbibacter pacificus]MDG3585617.1 DUF1214 domain-containing protein [Galbibacter pacificus]